MTGGTFDRDKIINYFKEGYSEKDSAYIDEVFCDDNQETELKKVLSRQFYDVLSEEEVESKNLDHILYKIHYEINTELAAHKEKKPSGLLRWSFRIAGIILLPVLLFWGVKGYLNMSTGKQTWVEIKAPAWTRAQFSLPDGTTGWLNSNSSIKYNGNFNTDRQITLNGEAFFDVFKDKARPFRVNTSEIAVKVLGTRFNIASYDNENNVEVVLEEGRLEFSDREMQNSRIMSPDELVIYNKDHKDLSAVIVEPKKYLAWTEGKLVFRNDPLDVIARRLERWYNIDVEVSGDLDTDLRLRATFIGEDLKEVLDLLKRSLPIEYKIENRDLKPDETYNKTKVLIFPRKK